MNTKQERLMLVERDRLREDNRELLAALEKITKQFEIILSVNGRVHDETQALICARAAIAKAKQS